jgi:hypothetical protein
MPPLRDTSGMEKGSQKKNITSHLAETSQLLRNPHEATLGKRLDATMDCCVDVSCARPSRSEGKRTFAELPADNLDLVGAAGRQ